MGRDRRKKIKHHLTESEIDELLKEAEGEHELRRIGFIKNLYQGDTVPEAADREGRSASTGDRWATAWNEGGIAELMPNFGGGRPPKLDEDEQKELLELLREGQPWKSQEIQKLVNEQFGVEYHPVYLSEFLRNLGLSYAKPRPKRPKRPENAEEILDERVEDALEEDKKPFNKREVDEDDGWTVDDDIRTDGGTVVGFFDVSHPQPYDNSHRVWYVDNPHIERPLFEIDEDAVGFYALNGESVLCFQPNQEKERICATFEQVREQNPGKRILLVLDNFSSHVCKYTRKRAHQLGIDLVFLPVGSPDLNPIEQVWNSLKRLASPIVTWDENEFRTVLHDIYQDITKKVSFAGKWISKFLNLQKLS
mgnify:CR=1 FL=1